MERPLASSEDVFRDDHPLHFRSALVDLCRADIAEKAFNDGPAAVPVRREDLHRLVGSMVGGL